MKFVHHDRKTGRLFRKRQSWQGEGKTQQGSREEMEDVREGLYRHICLLTFSVAMPPCYMPPSHHEDVVVPS